METDITSLLVGIISSLAATAILIGLSVALRRFILPWYADKIFRGVRIEGEWVARSIGKTIVAGTGMGMYLNLKQNGDVLRGTYSHLDDTGHMDIYVLNGCIRDCYFIATAVPQSKRLMDGMSLLFYIYNKGNHLLLTGSILYCGDPGRVGSHDDICFELQ